MLCKANNFFTAVLLLQTVDTGTPTLTMEPGWPKLCTVLGSMPARATCLNWLIWQPPELSRTTHQWYVCFVSSKLDITLLLIFIIYTPGYSCVIPIWSCHSREECRSGYVWTDIASSISLFTLSNISILLLLMTDCTYIIHIWWQNDLWLWCIVISFSSRQLRASRFRLTESTSKSPSLTVRLNMVENVIIVCVNECVCVCVCLSLSHTHTPSPHK